MAIGGKGPKGHFYLYDNVAKKFVEIHDGFLCGRLEGDLQFPDDKAVSRSQCRISISGNDVYIEDLNSTNRTKVNSAPMQAGFRRRIQLYDVIEFGGQRLILSHQDKFPANVQDRIDSGKLYPVARIEGGKFSSEISQLLTKRTLVLLDKATFRKLRLEETFRRGDRRKRPRGAAAGGSHRSTWILGLFLLLIWLGPWISLWLVGALESGLPNDSGEIVLGLAVMALIAGAVALAFYVRMFRPVFGGAKSRALIVLVLALGALLGATFLAKNTGILTRVAQNLAVARCVRGWDEDLCRTLSTLDRDGWVHFSGELRGSLEGKLHH